MELANGNAQHEMLDTLPFGCPLSEVSGDIDVAIGMVQRFYCTVQICSIPMPALFQCLYPHLCLGGVRVTALLDVSSP